MIPLTDRDLQDFQQSHSWFCGTRLPDGRILGNKDRMHEGNEPFFQTTREHLHLSGETSLIEFGAAEGHFSVFLAPMVKRLVCVEVRPRNVIALLTRLFVHDIRNVDVWLKDVSVVGPDWGRFDALFHVGVLYHLSNPVAHLLSLRGLADRLLLDTHYGTDDLPLPRGELEHQGKRYPGYLYRERGWQDPYSGVEPASCWLRRDVLLDLLTEIGYRQVTVLSDHLINGMPRFTVVASQ